MRIGFDAKRAFFNSRGLGYYSRDVIRILSYYYDSHSFFLFTPRVRSRISFDFNDRSCQVISPKGLYATKPLQSLWRTCGICSDISDNQIDLYHGLSHELPYGLEKSKIKKVVTIHDLIFLKQPELFPFFDRYSFRKKYLHGIKSADRIIAISEETKGDLINYLGEKEEKIDVVYQGYNPVFKKNLSENLLEEIRQRYHLPLRFMLIVCAIEKRKNHELILKAMRDPRVDIPLVVVGQSSEYKKELLALIDEYHLEGRVFFVGPVTVHDLPALYKLATLFVYPSLFEGFGRPILESLVIGTPVVTSKGSCFRETGGDAAIYVSPDNEEELSEAIYRVCSDETLRNDMIEKGFKHATYFSDENIAKELMATYQKTF